MGLSPFPDRDPIAGVLRLTARWAAWFLELFDRIAATPERLKTVTVTDQTATLGPTAFVTQAPLSAGLYRVTITARLTRAATVSSSLAPAVRYTRNGVVKTDSGSAITGNTTGTAGTSTFLLRIDAATSVEYQATYASSGATTLRYDLDAVFERVGL